MRFYITIQQFQRTAHLFSNNKLTKRFTLPYTCQKCKLFRKQFVPLLFWFEITSANQALKALINSWQQDHTWPVWKVQIIFFSRMNFQSSWPRVDLLSRDLKSMSDSIRHTSQEKCLLLTKSIAVEALQRQTKIRKPNWNPTLITFSFYLPKHNWTLGSPGHLSNNI